MEHFLKILADKEVSPHNILIGLDIDLNEASYFSVPTHAGICACTK